MIKKLAKIQGKLEELGLEKQAVDIYNIIYDIDSQQKPVLLKNANISDGLRHHLQNGINISIPIYRVYSSAYYDLFEESRVLWKAGGLMVSEEDEWFLNSDIGKFAEWDGQIVPLDIPMLVSEEEDILKQAASYKGKSVKLNSPRRIRKGESSYGKKKFVVFVSAGGGKIKRVTFGDPNLAIKNSDPETAKSFRARHKCSTKKDKTSPGYWSCNVHRYWKQLGLSSNRPW